MTTRDSLQILQLGPVWILSAVTGSGTTFSRLDLDTFWETVYAVAQRTSGAARDVIDSVLKAGPDLFLAFELDERPLVSGMRQVTEVLAGMDAQVARDYKLALLRIGVGLATARGPYGRQVSPENEQMLVLLAELLELRSSSESAR